MKEKSSRRNDSTSWGAVAPWYDELLETDGDTYQSKVIWPNLLRLLGNIKSKKILDLACGQGFFSREIFKQGAEVTGVDISEELIVLARKHSDAKIKFLFANAERLPFPDQSFDTVIAILALQNIENLFGATAEIARVLKADGRFILVLNHPAFRIPKESFWEFDAKQNIEYRRIGRYLSESRAEIIMNPGKGADKTTVSFHRPLQMYFKALAKNGLAVTRLEEWISHRESAKGPRKEAEDKARKEFPLFLSLEAKKI